MKKKNPNFKDSKKNYIDFLKKNKIYQSKKIFFYENNVEKMANWTNVDFKKTLKWYDTIRKNNKAKVELIHLEKMKKWKYNKKKGIIERSSIIPFFLLESSMILWKYILLSMNHFLIISVPLLLKSNKERTSPNSSLIFFLMVSDWS